MLLHPSEKEMQQLSGGTMPRLVTVSQSLVVTSEWELLLSQPHSPSQHSLPITHCTLHACILLSAAGHMTALLSGRSLMWLVGSFAGDAPDSTYPLQSGGHNGGGEHLTLSALRGPHPPEWTSLGHTCKLPELTVSMWKLMTELHLHLTLPDKQDVYT